MCVCQLSADSCTAQLLYHRLALSFRPADVVEIKHIMLPPDPRTYKDLYVVFELLESDLHTVIGANDDLTQDHHKVGQ